MKVAVCRAALYLLPCL